MEVHADFVAERLHKIVYQHGLKLPHPLLLYRDVVREVDAPADIDHRAAERLIERHDRVAKPPNTRTIAERLAKRAAHHDPHILDRVMLIDMEVAARLDHQIEEAMAREAFEHMVEKRHAGMNFAAPRTVQREHHRDRRLARLALDSRLAQRRLRSLSGNRSPSLSGNPRDRRRIAFRLLRRNTHRVRFIPCFHRDQSRLVPISPPYPPPSFAPQLDSARVPLETLHPGEPRDLRSESLQRDRRRTDYTGSLDKIVCAQGRGETRRTPRRQHVIRTGEVVAERR